MKKTLTVMLVFAVVSAAAALPVLAQTTPPATKTFTVSAEVEEASSFSISAFSVDPTTLQFTAVPGLDLEFGILDLDPATGNYFPDHFFAIDVGPAGGVGNPNVTAVYTEGNNPNQGVGGNGLGHKSTITFVKVAGATGSQTETGIGATPKIRLIDSVGAPGAGAVNKSQLIGGFLRMYVGIVTFNPTATYPDPANAETFTGADQHGIYDGTLVITASAT